MMHKPQTELLDFEFHAEVTRLEPVLSYESWMDDCYDSIMQFIIQSTTCSALYIGKSAMEAGETICSIGYFTNAIVENWQRGLKDGREPFDWRTMPWDKDVEYKYLSKSIRHFIMADLAISQDEKIKHLAALFCNANILWRRTRG